MDFYAADGRTRLNVPPAFVAGAGTASYVTHVDAGQTVITVHFRPAGAPFGSPLGELENSCIGLAELWGDEGMVLHERLMELRLRRPGLPFDLTLVRRRCCQPSNSTPRSVSWAARELTGHSAKRLTGLFRAEVGLAPKAYLRGRRLQAALKQFDAGRARGAAVAADLGYFDQAHLVREFRSLTAVMPARYAQRRSWVPSHIELTAVR